MELWEAKYSGGGQLEVFMAQPDAKDAETLIGSPILVRFPRRLWRLSKVLPPSRLFPKQVTHLHILKGVLVLCQGCLNDA